MRSFIQGKPPTERSAGPPRRGVLLLRDCGQERVLQRVRSGTEVETVWLAGGAYLTLFRKIKERGNKYRAQGWLGVGEWLAGNTVFLAQQSLHESSVPGRSSSIVGLEIYFSSCYPTAIMVEFWKLVNTRVKSKHYLKKEKSRNIDTSQNPEFLLF